MKKCPNLRAEIIARSFYFCRGLGAAATGEGVAEDRASGLKRGEGFPLLRSVVQKIIKISN